MRSFAAVLMFGFCMVLLAGSGVAQAPSSGAQGGNPNNTVPYGAPSAQSPATHASPAPAAASESSKGALAPYSGCVLRSATDRNTLVLNADSVCAVLAGRLATSRLAGHQIDLKGVLTRGAAHPPGPASIQVDAIVHVGASCSDACSPLPPGKRGLGSEKPGKEGGTPGAAPTGKMQ